MDRACVKIKLRRGILNVIFHIIEARELERVKKAFEKAYKQNLSQEINQNTNQSVEQNSEQSSDADTKYSLSDKKGEISNVRTDEFRRLQEESQRLPYEEQQLYRNGSKKIDENLRSRLSRVLGERLGAERSSNSYDARVLNDTKTGNTFEVYGNVDGQTFVTSFIFFGVYYTTREKDPEYVRRREEKKVLKRYRRSKEYMLWGLEDAIFWLWLLDRK